MLRLYVVVSNKNGVGQDVLDVRKKHDCMKFGLKWSLFIANLLVT